MRESFNLQVTKKECLVGGGPNPRRGVQIRWRIWTGGVQIRGGSKSAVTPGPESCTVCRKVVAKIKGLCVATPALNAFISNAVESHQKSTSDYRLLKSLVGYVLPAWTR